MNYYSSYKAAFHQDKIRQLRKGELITPVFAQIDLTNACNLNCSFCSYKVGNFSDKYMTDFNVKDKLGTARIYFLLEEMKKMGVKAIEWTGGGEPTLHPDWKRIISYAEKLGYEQALVTNGTCLNDEGIELIKDFEWVRFSIDAVTERTYFEIKGQRLLRVALENLKKLIERKSENTIIGFSFIICPDNYREIYDVAILAKELGCDNIRFSLAYTPQGEKMFENIWNEITDLLETAKQEETENFKVFVFSNRINEISQKIKTKSCYFHEFVVVIGSNGAVYPCCLLKYDPRFNFGNLKEQSFEKIWFGDKRKKFTEQIRKGCNYSCWMTQKNDFISFLVNDKVKHVNFI